MHILVFNWRDITHPAHGGAEVYTHEVLRRLVARGHEVTLFSAQSSGQPPSEVIDGIDHVRAGGRFGVYRAARLWYSQVGFGQDHDVVVDQINTRPFNCQAWVKDTPVVGFAHQIAKEIWFAEFPFPAALVGRFFLEPLWLRQLRHLPTLTVSNSSRQSLLHAGLQRVVVVPEGVDSGSTSSPTGPAKKEQTPTAIFVGRLAANKRPDHAVEAVLLARRVVPNLQIWVVGDGPLASRLQGLDGVTLFGRVSQQEKQSLMARAHVLVATSVREGWGLVVDEAAAVGTPTIGYDVAGLRDSITASDGWLVEARPEALAQQLVEVLPSLVGAEPRSIKGGAVSWDDVADEFLRSLTQMAAIS